MELFCPECLGTLESRDGLSARCTVHGGTFKLLFSRYPVSAPLRDVNAPPPVLVPGAVCAQHPSVAAVQACNVCGKPVCAVCDFTQPDGTHQCPDCAHRMATAPAVAPPVLPAIPAGVHCVQHPQLAATGQCKVCGAYMCDTCAFDVPGGIKVCPSCAANPRMTLSPRRKKALIISFVLAVWSTLMMAGLFGGLFRPSDQAEQEGVGLLMLFFLLAPAITGFGMGMSTMDKRFPTSIATWIAVIWNGIIVGAFLLLMVVGIMKG